MIVRRHFLSLVLMGLTVFPNPGLRSQEAPSQALPVTRWQAQQSGTGANLRGISAVSGSVAWASGTMGIVLRTVDSGQHWDIFSVSGAADLDFRDIRAFDENTAFALSAGQGEQSRIYKTVDGGLHWQMQFINHDPKAFFDCFAFWDRKHGIALSDSVNGKFLLVSTSDGESWTALAPKNMPDALPEEGAFAASGTCITTFGKQDVWFATGYPGARVFHSTDRGETWAAVTTPIRHSAASQGIFSVVFWTHKDGAIVGGDYKDPGNPKSNAAFTRDGGRTWEPATRTPAGYRSAVAVTSEHGRTLLAAFGITGADFSSDGGQTWTPHPLPGNPEYNSVSFSSTGVGWAVGPQGRILRYESK